MAIKPFTVDGNIVVDEATLSSSTTSLVLPAGTTVTGAGTILDAANSDTDDLSEGTSNLYFTDARADARIALQAGANLDLSGKTTTDLSEGTNLYYTDTRADARIALQAGANLDLSSKSTTDLSEGTNLYYTDARADARIAAASITDLSDADQSVQTTDNVTFANITATGYIAGPATFTIDPAAVGDATGTVVILGDLQVDGTTTTINSTTLDVDDLNITVASGAANAAAANGAGLTVDGASATLTYDSANDRWAMNKSLATNLVGNVTGNVTGTVDDISNFTTTDLTEGTNLYYTNARADARIALQTGANLNLSLKDTDALAEGSNNLYFTDARVESLSITGGSLRGTVNDATVQYATSYSGTPVQGSFFFDSLNQKLKVYTGSAFVDAVPAGSGGGGGGATDASATFRKYTYTATSATNSVSGKDDIVVTAGDFVTGYQYEIISVGTTDFTLIGASSNTAGVTFTATDVGSGTGTAGHVLNYDTSGIENVEVYVNGIKQVEGASYDYAATTGTSVTFTSNLAISDVVDVQVYELLTQDSFYTKTETYTQAETNTQISTALTSYLPLTGGTVTGSTTFTANTNVVLNSGQPKLRFIETDTTDVNFEMRLNGGNMRFTSRSDDLSVDTERMRIDNSTGDIWFYADDGTTQSMCWDADTQRLGIGLANPSNPLHIQSSDNTLARFQSTDATSKIALQDSTDTAFISKTANHLALGFNSTHNDQTLFITSAGKVNVGLDGGTTASLDAMLTVLDEFRVVTQVSVPNNTTGGKISLGATGLTNQAAQAEIAVHRGSNSSTGDLSFATGNGTAITEKMRILDNGNVGIGTDNPGRQLTLSNSGAALLSLVSTGDDNCQILFGDSASDTVGKVLYRHADDRLSLQAGNTEIVHVLSSGVGIGTNTPSYPLDIVTDAGDAEFRLRTLGTNAADHTIMRFQLGGTTGSNYIYFGDSGDSNAGQIRYNHGNDELTINVAATEVFSVLVDGGAPEYIMGDNSVGVISSSTRFTLLNDNDPTGRTMDMYRASTSGSNHIQNWYSDVGGVKTLVAAVEANGDFNSATSTYAGISDARLKENIVDATSQLDDIKAVQVRNFNFINNPEVTMLGVVAQELEASGMTGLVKTANDEDTGEEIKSVKYSVLYMKAIKALQETIAKVEALETENTAIKARLDALEGS